MTKIKKHLDEKIEAVTNRKRLEKAYTNAVSSPSRQLLAAVYDGHTEGVLSEAVSLHLPCDQDFYMTAVIEISGGDVKANLAAVSQILASYKTEEKYLFSTI